MTGRQINPIGRFREYETVARSVPFLTSVKLEIKLENAVRDIL